MAQVVHATCAGLNNHCCKQHSEVAIMPCNSFTQESQIATTTFVCSKESALSSFSDQEVYDGVQIIHNFFRNQSQLQKVVPEFIDYFLAHNHTPQPFLHQIVLLVRAMIWRR